MRPLSWPPAFALTLCLCLIARAAAPSGDIPDLTSDIIGTQSPLNAGQQRKLEDFVRGWTDRLIGGEDDQITEARAKLVDTLQHTGASPIFTSAFISALSPQLAKALAPTVKTFVRLNAMIVASKQVDANSIGLILMGLNDACPAVRYWAAKGLVQLAAPPPNGPRIPLSADQQKVLLKAATDQLGKEESDQVVEQLMAGIVEFVDPQALDLLITELNKRVAVKGLNPGSPLNVDERGLAQIFRVVVTLRSAPATAAKVSAATLNQFALASYRFMTLALWELNNNQVTTLQVQRQYSQMVDTCDGILKWVAAPEQQNAAGAPSGSIKSQLDGKDWSGLLQGRAQQWNNVLHGKPFNFTDTDLNVDIAH